MASSDPPPERRKTKTMLKNFYGLGAGDSEPVNPLNINSPHFNPDMFISKMIKERSLTELMDQEREVHKEIQSLDSDMQTLVYENYNKFISATDTIRKMKNDFKRMEDEMDGLATNMESITTFSGQISNTLRDRRQQITKLASVHTLLKKLQFLFELPARLNKCIELGAYSQAVRYYLKAEKVLHQYEHMPSFHGIQVDCDLIVTQLKVKLREQFQMKEATARQLTESVDLLLQLQEPAENLCQEFLDHAEQKLLEDLSVLEKQVRLQDEELPLPSQCERPSQAYMDVAVDVLEFIDLGCNNFLTNICLVIASYSDMFINRLQDSDRDGYHFDSVALKKLVNFVMALMNQYFETVQKRIELEKVNDDNTILVRALDRFHRRLQAMNSLLPDTDFARTGTDIVSKAGKAKCAQALAALKSHFADAIMNIRQNLITSKPAAQRDSGGPNLPELLHMAEASILEQLRNVLCNLQAFIQTDITFSMKPYFRDPFCKQDVREGVVLNFFRHINDVAFVKSFSEFCDSTHERTTTPPPLLLILSRMCMDFESSTISTMLALTDEYFETEDPTGLTPPSAMCAETKEVAQKLLNHYVRVQGLIISQMLRKSVETRDWLNTIEPRTVRAVMKRVVEDVTAMDAQVGQMYEEGVRRERSSDSSRRVHSFGGRHVRTTWSSYTPSTIDNSLISNIQKLFSERIEFFSSVQFSKVSILTGIIKISLKTFLECVRLRTFGRYGLQQIQVDTHYLQLYLWRFVSDENLVHVLLDEILGSSVHRCLDPVLMEQSVVDVICDRG